jgi:putative endonuclease
MQWSVYILFCNQKTFYIGLTNDIDRRLLEHQKGYSPYTKKFSDLELVYLEKYPTRQKAEQREQQLKGWSIAKKKALISNNKLQLVQLSKGFELVEDRGRAE